MKINSQKITLFVAIATLVVVYLLYRATKPAGGILNAGTQSELDQQEQA